MQSKIRFSLVFLLVLAPTYASANGYSFKATKTNGTWACSGTVASNATPITVSISVEGLTGSEDTVKLTATIELETGKPIAGAMTRSKLSGEDGVWRLPMEIKEAKAKLVTISGSIEGKDITCTPKSESETPRKDPISQVVLKRLDLDALEWLATNSWRFDLLRGQMAEENPKRSLAQIVFLPHLPSGAKAPSYPTSISERDLAQVVMIVPAEAGEDDTGASLEWALNRCESIPLYRVYGSIEGLASAQSTVGKAKKPEFKMVRLGHAMSCGADALSYTVRVIPPGTTDAAELQSTVPVRPVYDLGATGIFGLDGTMQSSFIVRDGKIDEASDRVGPGLLVGATYFVKGVDFGDMRWYNHFANPFVVVALDAPKDRFAIGLALTRRGGISLALGVAFNHVSILPGGYKPGDAFAGPGDIPLDKDWKTGFYIGVGVDDKLLASLRKLTKSGSGGGAATTQAVESAKAKDESEKKAEKKGGTIH